MGGTGSLLGGGDGAHGHRLDLPAVLQPVHRFLSVLRLRLHALPVFRQFVNLCLAVHFVCYAIGNLIPSDDANPFLVI